MIKTGTLKSLVVLSIAAVIVLPAYVIMVLPPQFAGLIVEDSKNDAVRIAKHIISGFEPAKNDLVDDSFLIYLKNNDAEFRKDFQLVKLKLFLPSGQIIYSSDPEDVGQINTKDYFFNIVAQGKIYPKLVAKDSLSLEGQSLRTDVVETYVPIMRDGRFIGAFEIYLDITPTKSRLDNLIRQIHIVLLLISAGLLIFVLLSYFKVRKSIKERKDYELKLHNISITDDLTGLLNRRGFMTLAEKRLKQAERSKECLYLLYADIDNMKYINDNWGHKAGDQTLIEVAEVFQNTFRSADILSRLGGDEFAALLTCKTDETSEETINERLRNNLAMLNKQQGRHCTLDISVGITRYPLEKPCSLSELMTAADNLMYVNKKQKKTKKDFPQ